MFEHDSLSLIWFALLGFLLVGYAILDGFDFGVGILHPIAKSDRDRRIILNSIGPLWDGNEVWLVTFGGALFAAFPEAYATVFSGFYVAFMLLLFALIFRAVSIEFRSKAEHARWRTAWDYGFFGSSLLAAFLFGVAAGNVMQGMPVNEDMIIHQSVWEQLTFYPLLVGVLTVALFSMHGAIFLYLKTEGELQKLIERWIWRTFGFFLIAYIFTTMVTLVEIPRAFKNFHDNKWLWAVPALNVLAVANIPRAMFLKKPVYAFVSSCATIAAFATLFATAIFPNLVPSSLNESWHMTVYNARSSEATLRIMLLIAVIGLPFVITYSGVVYWTFRGKVHLARESY